MRDDVRIDELALRLPGVGQAEVRELVTEVLQRVASKLPSDGPSRRIGSLDLQLHVPEDATREQLVSALTSALLARLS